MVCLNNKITYARNVRGWFSKSDPNLEAAKKRRNYHTKNNFKGQLKKLRQQTSWEVENRERKNWKVENVLWVV